MPAAADVCLGVLGGSKLGRPPGKRRTGDSGRLRLGRPFLPKDGIERGPGDSDLLIGVKCPEKPDKGGVGGGFVDDVESLLVARDTGTKIPDVGEFVVKYRTLKPL